MDSKTLVKEEMPLKVKLDCEIGLFTKITLPTIDYYSIGTCEMTLEVFKKNKDNNIQILQSCACLKGGDAIILINHQENKVIRVAKNTGYDFNNPSTSCKYKKTPS